MSFATNRGDGVGIPQTNQVVVSTSITILAQSSAPIGFVQSIQPSDQRRVDRVRHLDAVDAGRTIEQAPGPEDHSIRMTGFAVYGGTPAQGSSAGTTDPKGSFLERLLALGPGQSLGDISGRVFRCLSSQIIPFDLFEERRRPGLGNKTTKKYMDVWMTNFSSPVQITNITIAEEVQGQPTWIE